MSEPPPRISPPHIEEVRRAIWQKGFGGAKPIIERILGEHPDDPEVFAYACLLRLWTGDLDGAEAAVDERLARQPHPALYGAAAEIAEFRGDSDRCETLLAKAAAIDPDDYIVLRAAHSHLSCSTDCEAAVEQAMRTVSVYPQDPDVYSGYILTLQIAGRHEEEQRLLDESPDWFRGTAQYYMRRGMLLLHRQQMSQAEEELRLAVAACPEGGSYWASLSMALRFQDKWEEAERAANFALDVNWRNPIALITLSKAAQHRGDMVRAKELANRATEAIPALRAQAYFTNAQALAKAGKPLEAIGQLREVLRRGEPIQIRTARQLIVAQYCDAGKWSEARVAYQEALANGSSVDRLRTSEFRILVHEGRTVEAATLLEQALSEPEPAADLFPHAVTFLSESGQDDRVGVLAERFSEDLPGTPGIAALMVLHLAQCGHKELARQVFNSARRRYRTDHTLTMIEVAMTAEDGDLVGALRRVSSLPPHLRQKLLPTPMAVAKKLVRGLFSKKK